MEDNYLAFDSVDHRLKTQLATVGVTTVKTGTTIVAMVADCGVVLGADLQGTLGPMKQALTDSPAQYKDRFSKIFMVTKHIGFQLAGNASAGRIVHGYLTEFIHAYQRETHERITPYIVAKNWSYALLNNPSDAFITHIVGWNHETGKGEVYRVFGDGFIQPQAYVASGSGMPYAMAVLTSNYQSHKTADLTAIEQLVKNAVYTATAIDLYSGFGIQTVVLTEAGFGELRTHQTFKRPHNERL